MAHAHDLVIRGGRLADGTGGPIRSGDVAVRDGRISAVGEVDGSGARELDADGALVTPGFVDIHSHYDGQVTWDSRVAPSSWHGVTTVVMGNCGVGFAPVRTADHDRLIELMEGVEDIPGAALHEGISWEWEGFPSYLDAIERLPHDIDVAAQVPHGALRLYVMGERGAAREPATPSEIEQMAALVREAVEAGALGFSSSRTVRHRSSKGEITPSHGAAGDELLAIAAALGDAGAGVIEVISDFVDLDDEFSTFRRMAELSRRPLSISLAQHDDRPGMWRDLLDRIEQADADGLEVRGQVAARPIGVLLGLQATLHPFLARPVWREVADRPLREQVAALRDPSFRERLLADEAPGRDPLAFFTSRLDKVFPLGDPPDYEPLPEASVAARAARDGRRPEELVCDLLTEGDGRSFLWFPLFNYTDFDFENLRTMLTHPNTVLGLADGGAHCGTICDASFPTTMLVHWGRDRSRGEGLELPWIVRAQTRDTARAVGLGDRGVLAEGAKADLNVIDFERLRLRAPQMAYDLPAGGKRLLQRAEGYVATIVSGEVVYADGEPTDALPGRLVRGGRPAPVPG